MHGARIDSGRPLLHGGFIAMQIPCGIAAELLQAPRIAEVIDLPGVFIFPGRVFGGELHAAHRILYLRVFTVHTALSNNPSCKKKNSESRIQNILKPDF
jgi:hypothetical protein